MIGGFTQRDPQEGQAQLFGRDVRDLDDATRARIGYVPQQSDLFEQFTAAQLLAYFTSCLDDAFVKNIFA
mgnify:CR=1 FL=1